jgi:hypothetical protein
MSLHRPEGGWMARSGRISGVLRAFRLRQRGFREISVGLCAQKAQNAGLFKPLPSLYTEIQMQHAAMLSTRRAKQKHAKALAKAARSEKKLANASRTPAPAAKKRAAA